MKFIITNDTKTRRHKTTWADHLRKNRIYKHLEAKFSPAARNGLAKQKVSGWNNLLKFDKERYTRNMTHIKFVTKHQSIWS